MTLTQHYSAAPICVPARAALMTGRYPQRTGVVDTLAVGGLARLNPGEPTLPEYLCAPVAIARASLENGIWERPSLAASRMSVVSMKV